MIDYSKIKEIKVFLENNSIPRELDYAKHCFIFDTEKFFESHIKLIESKLGSEKFKKPYYDRLLDVFQKIK